MAKTITHMNLSVINTNKLITHTNFTVRDTDKINDAIKISFCDNTYRTCAKSTRIVRNKKGFVVINEF